MKNKKIFTLDAFKGKASILQYENENGETVSELWSYETKVSEYNHEKNQINVFGWHSSTTGRHINAFLEFYGFDPMSKKELFKKFNLKK